MKFKNRSAYKISATTTLIILLLFYVLGIYFAITGNDINVGDSVAVLMFAILLTPGTILIAYKQKWAVIPIIILYFLAFFSFVTPLAASVLIYALFKDRN